MEIIGAALVVILIVAVVLAALWILVWIIGISTTGPTVISKTENPKGYASGMNQGDYHSGPEGYSPNTAYPDTFYGSGGYGSGGSNDDFGGHDEGDFNR
jgi:hypothetical protein